MISMCGNCSAKVLSVMDGQRPQIRCEGLWHAPYITARTALLPLLTRRCVSRGSDVWKQSQGVGVVVTGVGSWELRYQVPDFVTIFVSPSKPLCSGYSGFVYRARLSGWLVG
jgi:hypothetical protein